MFANPPLSNTYLAARYHLSDQFGSDLMTREELLLPGEQQRLRGWSGFAVSFRDKALANALAAYDEAEREYPGVHAPVTTFGPKPLAAVSRWAAWRFEQRQENASLELRRVELWRADVPIVRLGQSMPRQPPRWRRVDVR